MAETNGTSGGVDPQQRQLAAAASMLIVDIVGDPVALHDAFKTLREVIFRGVNVHLAIRGDVGALRVDTLEGMAAK